ncbi:MAG: LysM peptidoglycan-binding protein [Bacillales bacterium]|nr:LysM peptidoglycan-binding protein [Bacillales bacterium]
MYVLLYFQNKKVFKKSAIKQHPPFAALIFGEVSMSEEQNCLTFSLTENVRFQKGQEVQELLSISLEPNVTCHEFDQYVILQGTLDCVGEYSPIKLEEEAEVDFYNVQKCAKVTPNGEGDTYTFCYSFPVDITIPADRCRDGEELTVDIQSFEYKIQDEGCINVSCEFCVNGVYDRAFLENEKADQLVSDSQQNDIVVDEVRFDSVEPQYGYGQQDFDACNSNNEYPQYQDLVRQSPETEDQNQQFEQTILDNSGYHPYYSHPQYGEQDWQRQWNDWDRSDTKSNETQEYQVPQQEYQVIQEDYQMEQDYQTPLQEYQATPMEEPEVKANYYQSEDIQQPFYQTNQQPWLPNQSFQTPKYSEPLVQPEQYQQPGVQPEQYQQPSVQPDLYQQPSVQPDLYQQPGFQPDLYQQPGFQPEMYQQPSVQPEQYQQPVQFQQVEQQQFGDITNFRLNVYGLRDETGYKSIFHDELESPKGPAFDSVESPEPFVKFESPEFMNPPMIDELETVEVFAEVPGFEEVDSVDEEVETREEVPLDVDPSFDQLIYPFESNEEPLNENEFYVEVKREPYGYETDYESQQEMDESPEYVEFYNTNQLDQSNRSDQTSHTSCVQDIFASREERSTCLKICIVQRGDSFEKLAQRYSIHPHKIARFNDLQPNAVLEEGAILYIPK